MKNIIITYNDIYEMNQKLAEKKLNFKVHLHDICGGQSFTIEPLSDNMKDKDYDDMKKVINEYFEENHLKIKFLENNLEFVILQ